MVEELGHGDNDHWTFASKRTKHGQFYYDVPRGLMLLYFAL